MTSKIQSILFDRTYWKTKDARNWLIKNKFNPIKRVDKTLNFYRYRLRTPNKQRYYYRISNILSKDIKLVIQYRR